MAALGAVLVSFSFADLRQALGALRHVVVDRNDDPFLRRGLSLADDAARAQNRRVDIVILNAATRLAEEPRRLPS